MLFSWLKRRRRRRLLAEPVPAGWIDALRANVLDYDRLSDAERAKLRDDARIFIAEKRWEGLAGLRVTDEIQVTIAGNACLLVLGLDIDYFNRVPAILVYPSLYTVPPSLVERGEGGEARLGEAHYGGPVVLSWADIRKDLREAAGGRNLIFHEFAHHLDFLDWAIDGVPPLETREQLRRWRDITQAEYERLVDATREGRATLLDHYGASNRAEFFAVATECFFRRPAEMRRRHPGMYSILRQFYRQDPAARSR
jgi:Mlc titration factor MtfA (ptsG expression regulator)